MTHPYPDIFYHDLHPEQIKAMTPLLDAMSDNKKRVYVQAPTRWGKSVLVWKFLSGLFASGLLSKPILITTDRRRSRKQLFDEGKRFAPELFEQDLVEEVKTIADAIKSKARVIIMSKHLAMLLHKAYPEFFTLFQAIIQDEGHMDLSDARKAAYENVNANLIALTATSGYTEIKSLRAAGYEEIYSITIRDAVSRKVISQIHNVLVQIEDVTQNLDTVPVVGGDYDPEALAIFLEKAAAHQKVAELFVARSRTNMDAGKAPNVSMAFWETISSAQRSTNAINAEWVKNFPDYTNPLLDKFWYEMPEKVNAYLFKNKIVTQKNIVALPVWGDMPDYVKDYLVEAHLSGAIPMQTSADLHRQAYTNTRVLDIYNGSPALSGVEVGQRGGRALNLDPNDPEKVATLFDFVYQSQKRAQLLYGDWAEGFLFLSSDNQVKNNFEDRPYHPANIPTVSGLKIISRHRDIVRYLHDRDVAYALARMPHLHIYPLLIAKAMVVAGLTSRAVIQSKVRELVKQAGMNDDPYWRLGTTENEIFSVLTGESKPIGKHGYTPAAILAAAVLKQTPANIFGVKPSNVEWRDLTAITERTQFKHIASVNEEDPELYVGDIPIDFIPSDDPALRYDQMDAFNAEPDPADEATASELRASVTQFILKLTPREERIVRLRFGLGGVVNRNNSQQAYQACLLNDNLQIEAEYNLDVIGQQCGLTKDRIRQILLKALRKLYSYDKSARNDNKIEKYINVVERGRFKKTGETEMNMAGVPAKAPVNRSRQINNEERVKVRDAILNSIAILNPRLKILEELTTAAYDYKCYPAPLRVRARLEEHLALLEPNSKEYEFFAALKNGDICARVEDARSLASMRIRTLENAYELFEVTHKTQAPEPEVTTTAEDKAPKAQAVTSTSVEPRAQTPDIRRLKPTLGDFIL